jgi:hypothetical protein
MFNLRFQLRDTSLALSNQSFHCYFTQSLPPSLNILVMFYNNKTYDVELLCEHFTRWEACKELRGDKFDKIGDKMGLENSMAMFGQHSSRKKKESKKCDLKDVVCYRCGSKGHLSRNCLTPKDNKGKDDKGKDKPKDGKLKDAGKGESSNTMKPSSGLVFTTLVNSSIAGLPLTDAFYVDSGASAHFILSKTDLCGYVKFGKPLEIAAVNNGKIQAYGSGTLRVMTSVKGVDRKVDLEDVYYVPGVHVRLLSLGKLVGQGWEVRITDGGMELKDRSGELFAVMKKTNNVYPVKLMVLMPSHGLAAWMGEEACMEPTYQDIIQRLDGVSMLMTAKGGKGSDTSLLTWHRRLGHPSFKTVVDLVKSGVSGMNISNIPDQVPGLDTCAACVAGKSIHLPHKTGHARASKYLECVHIDIAGPMPVASVGGRMYMYVVVDDHTRAVWMRLLHVKSEAVAAMNIAHFRTSPNPLRPS